jgi:hypothetical protein
MNRTALLGSVAGGLLLAVPTAFAATVANPICTNNTALFNPGNGEDIVVPPGYSISVFKAGLNFPTGIAFRKTDKGEFEVYVLESGHGLPSICNEQSSFGSGESDPKNPFTPDILVFNDAGKLIRGPLAKPFGKNGLQAAGPAVDIAFERGLRGGRLFATDSNQATHAAGQNNSSRIVVVDPETGIVTPFITGLPTGVQGQLDLLVTRFHYQQRRRWARQRRRDEPTGHPLPGHRAEQQCVRLRRLT